MADIVERLRAYAKAVTTHPPRQGFLNEAADEIERLRTELAEAKSTAAAAAVASYVASLEAENKRLLAVAGKIVAVGDMLNVGASNVATAMLVEAVDDARVALATGDD